LSGSRFHLSGAMGCQIPALLQHDIVDQVLSYCAPPPASTDVIRKHPSILTVPRESAWFATATRTCTSWVEPALRNFYRTMDLRIGQKNVSSLLVRRISPIGPRVRTLRICIRGRCTSEAVPDDLLDLFPNLVSLVIDPVVSGTSMELGTLSCAVLLSLTNLTL
jgi:hypothetical protein